MSIGLSVPSPPILQIQRDLNSHHCTLSPKFLGREFHLKNIPQCWKQTSIHFLMEGIGREDAGKYEYTLISSPTGSRPLVSTITALEYSLYYTLVTVLVTVTTGIRSKKSKRLMAHCRFPVRVLQVHILTLNEMHFTRSCPCSCYRAPLVEIQSCASNVRHWKATCFKSTTVVVSVTILSVVSTFLIFPYLVLVPNSHGVIIVLEQI